VSGSDIVTAGAADIASPRRSPRSRRETARAVAGAAVTLAVLAAAWWALAPPALGGSTSLVVVDGTSMLPHYHRSDLVALRPSKSIEVGDVVGYRSALLHRVVLHRVVAIRGEHLIFKGDNNSFIDPDRPTRADVVGELWFSVPSVGRAIGVLRAPWAIAALAAVLVLAVGLDGSRPRRGRSEVAPR
jgi:signal peptidase I